VPSPTPSEYDEICADTSFTQRRVRRLWDKFLSISKSQLFDGKIDVSELQSALAIRNRGFAERIFAGIDSDSSRAIDYREFVQVIFAMGPNARINVKSRFCFNAHNADKSGTISRTELRVIMTLSATAGRSHRQRSRRRQTGHSTEWTPKDTERSPSASFRLRP
jgi:Ca2+-binding EF-hand superfamily protein